MSAEETEVEKESRIGGFLGGLPRFIPVQSRIFRAMALRSLKGYHKRSGGDALAIDARAGGQLDLIPVKYRTAEMCDEGEKPGWKAKNQEKTWNAGSEGRVVDYLNDIPIVALDRDSHVECGWLRPRIAEAIELENYDGLHTNTQINLVADAGPAAGNGAGTARADGGQEISMEIDRLGPWTGDAIVDLGSGEDYDGMRVSFKKATEWAAETTTTQEMQMQEDRGYLRGIASAEDGPSIIKILLLCAAIILGSLAIIHLGPMLIGGEDVSAVNPLVSLTGSLIG